MATRFDKAFEGLRTTGASVSTHEVVEALDRHGREEAGLLERYRRFIEEAESPAARYLVQLILEDEQRHHRVLEELANTIAWGWTKGVSDEVVPVFPRDGEGGALRAETRARCATSCEIALTAATPEAAPLLRRSPLMGPARRLDAIGHQEAHRYPSLHSADHFQTPTHTQPFRTACSSAQLLTGRPFHGHRTRDVGRQQSRPSGARNRPSHTYFDPARVTSSSRRGGIKVQGCQRLLSDIRLAN